MHMDRIGVEGFLVPKPSTTPVRQASQARGVPLGQGQCSQLACFLQHAMILHANHPRGLLGVQSQCVSRIHSLQHEDTHLQRVRPRRLMHAVALNEAHASSDRKQQQLCLAVQLVLCKFFIKCLSSTCPPIGCGDCVPRGGLVDHLSSGCLGWSCFTNHA